MSVDFDFISKFPLAYIASAFISMSILGFYFPALLGEKFNFYLLVIISVFYLSEKFCQDFLPKIRSYFRFVDNFDNLPIEQQKILWTLLDKKRNLEIGNKDVIYLCNNKYIEMIQQVNTKEATFRLSKKMTKSLNKKIDNNVKKILQSPSNEEKEVLNLFYEDSNITRYPHYYSNALESLIEKNVIQRKNEKYIEITQYGLKHLKKFRPDKAKLEVELGNHNILAPCNSGSGAAGGMRR